MKKRIVTALVLSAILSFFTYAYVHYQTQVKYIQSSITAKPVTHKYEITDFYTLRADPIYTVQHYTILTSKNISEENLKNLVKQLTLDSVSKSSFFSQVYKINFEILVPNEALEKFGGKSSTFPATRALTFYSWRPKMPQTWMFVDYTEFFFDTMHSIPY